MVDNFEKTRFKIGIYMLVWFTNPNNVNYGSGIEQGLCTQFFTSLPEAERLAEMFSGPRIILMCTAQNPPVDNNVYWNAIKTYGDNFDLKELTVISNELHQKFIESLNKPSNN